MKILLIDADSTIPNLALMKLSTYHKSKGDNVELQRLNISYYPNKKKKTHKILTYNYDKVYCSAIFNDNHKYIKGDNIIWGGTAISLNVKLPSNIEQLACDYSIYPDNDTSYGFITRGCIRNCYFCIVPQLEGDIYKYNQIDNIIKHKKVKFMDNNILSHPDHKNILKELISKKVRCQFNQGLDIRLIDEENSSLLSQLNYMGEYIFAFDDISFHKLIERKLKLLKWRGNWSFKFYVYVEPRMKLSNMIKRINILKEWECLPYLMRNVLCWDSKYNNFYIDMAAWCNQPNIFKKMSFEEFLLKRHPKNELRVNINSTLYKDNQ